MANDHSADLQTWLKLLCQMLPGFGQAVLLTDSSDQTDSMICWPAECELHDDLLSTARLAAAQKKSVTTTLNAAPGQDSAADMIIAFPLTRTQHFTGTLAILVTIKPSQQPVVTQILRWGENWLELLFARQASSSPLPDKPESKPTAGLFGGSRLRWLALGIILLLGIMSFTSGTYRVTAAASLEGKIQHAIVAPFDGYIATANARAGETVNEGQVIAVLNTQELLLQQQQFAAEKNEYTRQYLKALSTRDQTQASIFKSQISQADAQLDVIGKKIERAALVSSLDGIIISGDLSRSLGAPVATGDVLFEVAPLDEYRLIILVNEKQVADVSEGLSGNLALKSLPGITLPFVVHKVSPVFEEETGGIAYRVEARLVEQNAALRPGMEGIAKIDIEERRLIWIYLHELFDLIRLWAWRWLP